MTAGRRSPQPSHPQADRFAGVERGHARFDSRSRMAMPPTAKSFHRNTGSQWASALLGKTCASLGKTVLSRIDK
jgi:hypothetical protein